MVARSSPCDRNRLKRALHAAATDPICDEVTQHVEHCEACRHELESIVAEDDWWQDARLYLSDDPDDDQSLAILLDSQATSAGEPRADTTVLQYLEPSDKAGTLGRLGAYDVLEIVGCGGMGIVLKGYDRELNRYVAIKVLAPYYAGSSAARKRFAREAQAAAAVVNPHVVAIHTVDATGKLPFLVMPLVAGESLQQRIDRTGPLGLREVLRIGLQAAQGLAAAHAQGLVHRDVKPANILLEKGVDRVLLTDFGLARAIDDATLTHSGIIAGTPQYMSPEQARGDAIDHRADLFSLGSVLYTMCAGRPPFRSETALGMLKRICEERPRALREVNPDIPTWLAAIIERLHQKRPEQRFESAAEVAALLERCLAHVQHPTAVPLPAALRPLRRHWEPRRKQITLIAVALAAIVVLSVVFAAFLPPEPHNSTQTQPSASSSSERSRETSRPASTPATATTVVREPVDTGLDWQDGAEESLQEIALRLQWLQLQE